MKPFDLLGPLPSGTTVLEASAGTGKTFTVGALVTRYVAEGVATLPEMLVITFGRAASQELRERVRAQLVEAERALADPASARELGGLLAHLATGDDGEVEVRRRRIADALADFDGATIATTHQFCQLVLTSLGVAGDTDARVTLVENLDELVIDVTDDLYLQRFADGRDDPPFSHATARELAAKVVNDPQAVLGPADADEGSVVAARVSFGLAVRAELDRRKQRLGILSFDDLLERLASALEEDERSRTRSHAAAMEDRPRRRVPGHRPGPVERPRPRVLRPRHARAGRRPQAVHLRASAVATSSATSTPSARPPTAGRCRPTTARMVRWSRRSRSSCTVPSWATRASRCIRSRPSTPVVASTDCRRRTHCGFASSGPTPACRASASASCARASPSTSPTTSRGCLASGATFDTGHEVRPVRAGDIAILMQSLKQVDLFRDALRARGIPSVDTNQVNVLLGRAGDEWLSLLEALEAQRTPRVRAVALSPFVGHTPASLDAGGDDLTDAIAEQIRGWLDLFRARGIAAVHEAIAAGGLAERVLAQPEGERLLTDLNHVAEALHDVAHRERLGLPALLEWLRRERRRAAAVRRAQPPPRHRRGSGAGRQHPPQQGPAVADRLPADTVQPMVRRPRHDPPPSTKPASARSTSVAAPPRRSAPGPGRRTRPRSFASRTSPSHGLSRRSSAGGVRARTPRTPASAACCSGADRTSPRSPTG